MSARDDILSMFDDDLSDIGRAYLRDLVDLVTEETEQTVLSRAADLIYQEIAAPPLGVTRKVSYERGMKRALKLVDSLKYGDWQK